MRFNFKELGGFFALIFVASQVSALTLRQTAPLEKARSKAKSDFRTPLEKEFKNWLQAVEAHMEKEKAFAGRTEAPFSAEQINAWNAYVQEQERLLEGTVLENDQKGLNLELLKQGAFSVPSFIPYVTNNDLKRAHSNFVEKIEIEISKLPKDAPIGGGESPLESHGDNADSNEDLDH